MKLPPMTLAFQGTPAAGPAGHAPGSYRAPAYGRGVAPQGIFDDILGTVTGILPNVGCLAKCGTQALGCLHCGTNLACWTQCAGPVAVQCIQSCL
ncbi:MAG TPA: hypothetical protein VF092_23530 [Longimicrobium sp.]